MYHSPSGRPTFSEQLYRLCLLAYPRAFREEYAHEMLLTFQDVYRETLSRQGTLGVFHLWSMLLYDFVKSVCIEHVNDWIRRDKRKIALAGKDQLIMTLQFTLDIAQQTDIGRTRANNEDNLLAIVPEDQQLLQAKGALFIVSDGMGGHDHGEVASELTVQQVKERYYQDLQHDIPAALQEAINQTNLAICTLNEARRITEAKDMSMGATCVAAVLHNQSLYVANVGDSRAYVLHAGQLRQITRDHSLVAQLVENGQITAEEARTHEKRNVIYRSLGCSEAEVDLFTESVENGDTLILCTDGLCSVVEDDDLRTVVEHYDPEESVQQLIARANAAGGPDNVTAIVVRISTAA